MRFGHFFYPMNFEGYVLDAVGESGRKRKPSAVGLARFRTRDVPDNGLRVFLIGVTP